MEHPAESAASYGGVGLALLRALSDRSASSFSIGRARDAANELGIAASYLPVLLHRLRRAGFVDSVKRGSYTFASAIPRVTEAHAFAVAMALVEPCAISGWAALN